MFKLCIVLHDRDNEYRVRFGLKNTTKTVTFLAKLLILKGYFELI